MSNPAAWFRAKWRQKVASSLTGKVTIPAAFSLLGMLSLGVLGLVMSHVAFAESSIGRSVLREFSAVLVVVSAAGFLLEFLGWQKRLEAALLPMILDPEYVTRLSLNPDLLKERIHTLIEAMYKGVHLPEALHKSVDADVLDKIATPFRVGQIFHLELSCDDERPGIVWLDYEVHYTAVNYSHMTKRLFGPGPVIRWLVRMIDGLDRQSLFTVSVLRVDGKPYVVAPPSWSDPDCQTDPPADIAYKPGTFASVACSADCDVSLPPGKSAQIDYRFRVAMLLNDYIVITQSRITKGLTVFVEYDPKKIGFVEAEFGVPFDWDTADYGREQRPGHLTARVSRYMFPGNSIIILWRETL